MDMNHRLDEVENASTSYIHQAEKFRSEATNLSTMLERSFLEAEQFINNRMELLSSQNNQASQEVENERALLLATRAKLDATLAQLTQCHQDAIRLQSNTDTRFHLMLNTAKGRLQQIERLKVKLMRYESSLEVASPVSEDVDLILSQPDNAASQRFQDELQRVTEQLKQIVDLGKEVRNETHIIHGQYDTDVNRQAATLMRHEKTEREQLSAVIEHKQSLARDIDWMKEQKTIIDNFITKLAPMLDKCLCDGSSMNRSARSAR